MTGWVPIVSDIVESSLWEEKDYVVKVFLTMLAKKDKFFHVHGDVYTIAKWANKTDRINEVVDAIRVLESKDTKKPLVKQQFDGRRIEATEGGWLILNGAKYRNLVSKWTEKERKRQWIANKREDEKALKVTDGGKFYVGKAKTKRKTGEVIISDDNGPLPGDDVDDHFKSGSSLGERIESNGEGEG